MRVATEPNHCLVDRLEDDPSKGTFNNDIKEYYKELLIEIFDFIREDEEFKLIIDKLNKL